MDKNSQEIKDRYDSLPEHLREFMFSEENADAIWEICESIHLSEEKIHLVSKVVAEVVLGLTPEENLKDKIAEKIGVDRRIAQEIADRIKSEVLFPVLNEINELYDFSAPESGGVMVNKNLLSPAFKRGNDQAIPHPSPQPKAQETTSAPKQPPKETTQHTSPTPTPPPQTKLGDPTPQSLSDKLAPAVPAPKHEAQNTPKDPHEPKEPLETPHIQDEEEPSPFMMHEEEELEPVASGGIAPLQRPYFFRSTAGEEEEEEPPISARLEIGQEQDHQNDKVVGRTKKENVKVVNYTNPEIGTDPFAGKSIEKKDTQPQKEQPKPSTPKEVPPDNVVNLKDLPK